MSLTITLSEPLVASLQVQAQARDVSVEQWALDILQRAAGNGHELDAWQALNQQRLALIFKRHETGLSTVEEEQLSALQSSAAEIVEPWDRAMLNRLAIAQEQAGLPPKAP